MNEIVNINAVLITGEDTKGNEYSHARFHDGTYVDLYNEVKISEKWFRFLYPLVTKVYFSEVTMTGDQWRDIQCPLSMTREQLEQWRENVQYVDVWADPRTPKQRDADQDAADYQNTIADLQTGFRQW